jgi:hypothetical protein
MFAQVWTKHISLLPVLDDDYDVGRNSHTFVLIWLQVLWLLGKADRCMNDKTTLIS